jgi:hypothetical protein
VNNDKDTKSRIGTAVVSDLYANVTFEKGNTDVDVYFVTHKQSVKAYLLEKREILGLNGKLLGVAGIEITIVLSILSGTFQEVAGVKPETVKGIFAGLAIAVGVYFIKLCYDKYVNWKKETITDLLQDFAEISHTIKSDPPSNKS